jgi:hypothetical protein
MKLFRPPVQHWPRRLPPFEHVRESRLDWAGLAPRDDHQLDTGWNERRNREAKGLPNEPFELVALDRVAVFAADRNSQPRGFLISAGSQQENEPIDDHPRAGALDGSEIAPFAKPPFARKRVLSAGCHGLRCARAISAQPYFW